MALASGTMNLSTTPARVTAGSCREVSLRNNDAAINILVGTQSAQNYTIGPGQQVTLTVTNRNLLWVKSASGTPVLSWIST